MQEFIIYRATYVEPMPITPAPLPGVGDPCCSPVEKSYIGHTSGTLTARREQHEDEARKHTPGDNSYFHNALRAHAFDFCWEIIGSATSREDAIKKEIAAILKYGTLRYARPGGYNLRLPTLNPRTPSLQT